MDGIEKREMGEEGKNGKEYMHEGSVTGNVKTGTTTLLRFAKISVVI